MTTSLATLPLGQRARIARIDWSSLSPDEGRRLRELGLMEDVEVETLHRGSLFSRDPLAVRIGRMQVVIRSRHAAAIMVDVLTDAVAA
jgi:ferrous iron transport protein A